MKTNGNSHDQTVALNQALMVGSVRQHELTDLAEKLNARLYAEIAERERATAALALAQAQLADHARQLEAMVAARTAELTSSNKQLEALIYSIAHDLRAPLRSMQGFAVLLTENAGAALGDAGRGFANRIRKSAHFMDALLIDLLEFSRVSQQAMKLGAVSLQAVVESTIFRLQTQIRETGAVVERLGPWSGVLAHEATLTEVISSLVDNGLKFAQPGIPPRIILRTEERGEFVRVWIEDNGIGIAAEYQEQIFRLFTRLNGEKYVGTGLGLAIVHKGIERMGGKAGVVSRLGHGSRFWIELRRA